MVKFKPPRVTITTIRGGRVHKSTIQGRPHLTFPNVTANDLLDVMEMPQPVPQDAPFAAPGPSTSYPQQTMKERCAWEQMKQDLRISYYESTFPKGDRICSICEQKPDNPITCRECSQALFCKECAVTTHMKHFMLHTLTEWQVCMLPIECMQILYVMGLAFYGTKWLLFAKLN